MLGYLDALLDALTVRNVVEAKRLLAHPLARLLPDEVRAEAGRFCDQDCDALAAPLRTMLHRRQTAELFHDMPMADQADHADQATEAEARRPLATPPSARRTRPQQIELPLSA